MNSFNELWAISPRGYEVVSARPAPAGLASPPVPRQAQPGVAVVYLTGVLQKNASFASEFFGDTAMREAGALLKAADADASVGSVILLIDSPGGTVDGTDELAGIVSAMTKPVTAIADGMILSAAYWIGSAADAVYLSSRTVEAGSIGVLAVHREVSGMEADLGIKTSIITAGKYKAIANPFEPLSGDGRAVLQNAVDGVYSIFVDSVAKNRSVSTQTVLDDMADGRVFIGDAAIAAGLADGYMTLNDAVTSALAGRVPAKRKSGDQNMDLQTLREKHPDLVKELTGEVSGPLQDEARKAGYAEGVTAGAVAERQRIQAVEEQSLPGHDPLIREMKFDGKTSGPEAAVRVLQAERASGASRLGAIREDAKPLAAVASASAPVEKAAALKTDEELAADWKAGVKQSADFVDPKHYIAFVRAEAAGNIRILRSK